MSTPYCRRVEDGLPARGEFLEAFLDESGGALGPGVNEGPKQSAAERGGHGEAEIGRSLDDVLHLLNGPFGAGLGVGVEFGRGEDVEHLVVRRMHGDELAEQV
jgi:hypothetical protein